jgi:DNA-binding MarR family transcriptional regulator
MRRIGPSRLLVILGKVATMKDDLPSQLTGTDDTAGYLLWEVANAWHRRLRQALEEIGLTYVQTILLAGLAQLRRGAGPPITQASLARHSRVHEMVTSQVIRVLEKRGLIIRGAHPQDYRAWDLSLTPEGDELLEKVIPVVEQAAAAFFLAVGGRLEGMIGVLKTMTRAVRVNLEARDVASARGVEGVAGEALRG